MMAITDEELEILVDVTGTFENDGDPYQGVSGDFDGQGISCGVLQWNIGQDSLQPLVVAVGKSVVLAAMPTFGAEMWKACNGPLSNALQIVRTWQQGKKLKARPRGELRSLMGSSGMREQQNAAIRKVAERAATLADEWASSRGGDRRTLHDLAWFFDVVTQNSSLKGLGFEDVAAFKKAAGSGRVEDLVCAWLAATTTKFAGMADCHKNAKLWRQVDGGSLDLLVLGYLRSQKSILQWRGDVLNRKGTLATKSGWVHGRKFDFNAIL